VDVRSVLDATIKNDPAIPSEIANEAHDRLTAAEQMLNNSADNMIGYIEKPVNISITELEIKGYQSHEDTKIAFTGGLNAIVGPSDSGKSAILRALRFVLYNEPK